MSDVIRRPTISGHAYTDKDTPREGSGIESLLGNPLGYIVGRLGSELLRLNTDAHLITVAPTRAGKGVGCVIPNLLDHPGSAFVVDIHGETVARTAEARLLMGHSVVVLDPYDVTKGRWGRDSINPLANLDPDDISFETNVGRLAKALMYDADGHHFDSPRWDSSTLNVLEGALTYILCYLPPERHTLLELHDMFRLSPENFDDLVDHLFQVCEADPDVLSSVRLLLSYLTDIKTHMDVTDNAILQIQSITKWIGWREFKTLTSQSSFDISRLQKEPTTIYLVLPEEYVSSCAIWVRLLFEQALFSLQETQTVFGKPSNALEQHERTLFMFDEFASFGHLDVVQRGITTVASRGANIWLFLQHISQLDYLYGEHAARMIIGNAACLQAFGSNEIHELEYYSRLIGTELFNVESVSISETEGRGGINAVSKSRKIKNSEFIGSEKASAKKIKATASRLAGELSDASQDSDALPVPDDTPEDAEPDATDMMTWGVVPHSQMGWVSRNWPQGFSIAPPDASRNKRQDLEASQSSFERDIAIKSIYEVSQTTQTDATNWEMSRTVTVNGTPMIQSIETARSLQRSLSSSGGGQLLKLAGHYCFLCPRLNYFERNPQFDVYRFPSFAILSGEATVQTLFEECREKMPIYVEDREINCRVDTLPKEDVDVFEAFPAKVISDSQKLLEKIRKLEESKDDEAIAICTDKLNRNVETLNDRVRSSGRVLKLLKEQCQQALQWKDHGHFFQSVSEGLMARYGGEPQDLARETGIDQFEDLADIISNGEFDKVIEAAHYKRVDNPYNEGNVDYMIPRDDIPWTIKLYGELLSNISEYLKEVGFAIAEYEEKLQQFQDALEERLDAIEDERKNRITRASGLNDDRRRTYAESA